MSETTELIGKTIGRLVDAIKAAGPSAEYGFQETLGFISAGAWGELVLMISGLLIGGIGLFFGIKYAAKQNWDDSTIAPVMIPGIIFFISGLIVMLRFSTALATAIHPVGHLVMEALK